MSSRKPVTALFDGSFEGFMCLIHAYYYEGIAPAAIFSEPDNIYQPALDSPDEFYVSTDFEKSDKVQQSISEKISQDAYGYVTTAFLSEETDKYMPIFQYILLGFKIGERVDDHLQQDCVLDTHRLARRVAKDAHILSGTCRFAETTTGVYYCAIAPKSYALPIVAQHFSQRLSTQPWIIHDKKRNHAAIYNGQEYIITSVPAGVKMELTANEMEIQGLWKTFFHALAIKERENYKVARTVIPLHYRKFMLEFH